ncbi:hypothetical protein [Jannaschia formosa]|uniref:hypothetical protein n=1 Tax=Jannaschia formosa TaxID=2259592 RepID=UPI000E1C3E33|nr:hypothetical protein [Jannaschia formosa]TFL15951.1 hypothetical protein DR046_22645 [Jannaschia formosa]
MNPNLRIKKLYTGGVGRYMAEFGITPTSRMRLADVTEGPTTGTTAITRIIIGSADFDRSRDAEQLVERSTAAWDDRHCGVKADLSDHEREER